MATEAIQRKEKNTQIRQDDSESLQPSPACVSITSSLDSVERDWRALEARGIESPGQSYDYIRQWISSFKIPQDEQVYIVAHAGARPVALLALHRTRMWGMNVFASFAGTHVGTNAPLIDRDYLEQLSTSERRSFWQSFTHVLKGADLAYIDAVYGDSEKGSLFQGLGISVFADCLHRSVFDSWETCDRDQRNRKRRKNDRQQHVKLHAMGKVTFEAIGSDKADDGLFETIFTQRSRRFAKMGVSDPFARENMRGFYRDVFHSKGALKGKIFALKLDGKVVGTRYCLEMGDRLFGMISSMDLTPSLQPGSPGKQCLMHIMQTVFDAGYSMVDMGAGTNDEKRHWCNVQIPLYHHYVPLSARGQLFALSHAVFQNLKARVKDNKKLFSLAKSVRARIARGSRAA